MQLLETGLLHADPHPGELCSVHRGLTVYTLVDALSSRNSTCMQRVSGLPLLSWHGLSNGGSWHAGNLLRTADGKICILDFGLMTEVAPERQIALVEYIAHLSVQDWNGVAKDLVNLGFTPEGMPSMMANVQHNYLPECTDVRMQSVSKRSSRLHCRLIQAHIG